MEVFDEEIREKAIDVVKKVSSELKLHETSSEKSIDIIKSIETVNKKKINEALSDLRRENVLVTLRWEDDDYRNLVAQAIAWTAMTTADIPQTEKVRLTMKSADMEELKELREGWTTIIEISKAIHQKAKYEIMLEMIRKGE